MTDPLNTAATVLLRSYLVGLEQGRFAVLELQASDNEKHLGMTIALAEVNETTTTTMPARAATIDHTLFCPECGSTNVGTGDTEHYCNDCGATWPIAPST